MKKYLISFEWKVFYKGGWLIFDDDGIRIKFLWKTIVLVKYDEIHYLSEEPLFMIPWLVINSRLYKINIMHIIFIRGATIKEFERYNIKLKHNVI